jgi:acetyl-CoA carboxylase / biotin carboxylase 1
MTEITGAAKGSHRPLPHVNGKATYAEKHKLADHFIGGNRIANAPASKVKDFVASHDGHTVITNVSKQLRMMSLLKVHVTNHTTPPRF